MLSPSVWTVHYWDVLQAASPSTTDLLTPSLAGSASPAVPGHHNTKLISTFSSRCRTFILVCNQPPRSTQPGHPFMGIRNEYQPKGGDALLLGSKGRFCVWVTGETVWSICYTRPYLSTLETGNNKALYKFTFFTVSLLYNIHPTTLTVGETTSRSLRSIAASSAVNCRSSTFLHSHTTSKLPTYPRVYKLHNCIFRKS